ncbi:hypothetical protein WPG_1679 [Winogradskyella sp. PG-2]|nr:hypothetical protein WPG_1679 [Winogradskyella sp. PG-2]
MLLTSLLSFGQLIATETFSYPDGPLLGNSTWTNHSGPNGNLLVISGQAAISHASSEDINLPFGAVPGNIYFAFDMTVQDPGNPITGTDNEYFAHFKDSGSGFFARVDLSEPLNGGDYVIGISTISTEADVTWPTDLTYGTTYRVTVKFDQDEIVSELWLDASTETDSSIIANDAPGTNAGIVSFALRQSDSADDETILIDNLKVAQSFNETSLSNEVFEISTFKIYPNPTNTGIVNIASSNSDEMNIQIFDMLGKQVKNATISNNSIDVSNLNTGIYLVKITQNNASTTKKLVIR